MMKNNERACYGSSNVINLVWNFLSSIKLGIVLLLILAAVSIIGTVWVPVDHHTGQENFMAFYNTWYFRVLLGLLALNLLICSINRWNTITGTLKGPKTDFTEDFIQNLKLTRLTGAQTGPARTAEKVKELLQAKRYRVFTKQDGDQYKISADRGRIGIPGPYLTHLSFIVIILALLVKFSGKTGFDGKLTGMVGQTYSLSEVQNVRNIDPSAYFKIKIKNFRTEYRFDGNVKQWLTDVTVIDKDKTFDYTIYVNNPLVYKGVKFYQSGYGQAVTGKISGSSFRDRPFIIGMGNYIQLPGTDLTFQPVSFNETARKVAVRIFKGYETVSRDEMVLNTKYKHEQAEIKFDRVSDYTVLQVKKDPGVPVIGAGSCLFMLGLTISFLIRPKKIWSVIIPREGRTVLRIGGTAARNRDELERDLDHIVTNLNKNEG